MDGWNETVVIKSLNLELASLVPSEPLNEKLMNLIKDTDIMWCCFLFLVVFYYFLTLFLFF